MVGLQPIKCQREGCEKFAHHFCSIEWASKNNLPEETIASLCRDHHLQYQMHVTAATAASDAIMKHPSPVAGTFTTSSPATAAAVAAAVAVFPSLTVDPGSDEMDVSGVSPDARGKSPVFSTANKSNPKTATKKKMNKKGEMVDVVDKEARITKGIRVFSERHKLLHMVKQGDPQYDIINDAARSGFRFYGTVLGAAKKRGYWEVEYDLFPNDAKTLVITRRQCTTLRPGEDEPEYDSKHEKIDAATERLELLDSEPEEDYDLALPDEHDDNAEEDGATKKKPKMTKKKKSRKVLAIESFLDMSDEGVVNATSFRHFHGEGDNDYIEWRILKEGEEITNDVMQHKPHEVSPFVKEIEWHPQPQRVDYFDIFFNHFFPSLKGKAAVLDKYLSDPRCSGHITYWVNEKVRFHRPDRPDPDYIVSNILGTILLFIQSLTTSVIVSS